MNVTSATTEVQARGFDYLSSARILIALNNAKNRFEDHYPWPWNETISNNLTAPVTVSDLRSVKYVVDKDNANVLQGIDIRDLVDIDPTLSATGQAQYWWLDEGVNTINVYPSDQSPHLNIRYNSFSPELVAGTDTPLIPIRYHAIWVDLAVLDCAKDDEGYTQAQQIQADVTNRLDELVTVYSNRNRGDNYQFITYSSEDW